MDKKVYELLLKNLSVRIFYKDKKSNYILINQAYSNDIGVKPEDIKGKTDFDIHPHYLAKFYRKIDADVIKSGKPKTIQQPYFLHDKQKQHLVEVTKIPVKNDEGEVIGVLGMLHDVTEKMQLIKKLQKTVQDYQESFQSLIDTITHIMDIRDPYTSGHQQKTEQLACAIAKKMGCSTKQIENISIASSVHDLGKIFIPMDLLNKPGALNDMEFDFVKTHSTHGYNLLKGIKKFSDIAKIVYQHHEREDGSGYPEGKKCKQISLEAKILAVADVVEAMTAHRPYRPAHPLEKALEEIKRNAGILYDQEVVKTTLNLFKNKQFALNG